MGSTATLGLPYPEDTDRVADGPAAMQALAEAVEAAIASETATINGPVINDPILNFTGAGPDTAISGDANATLYLGPIAGGLYVTNDGHVTIQAGKELKVDGVAINTGWTAYAPGAFGNMSAPAGSFAYKLIGKTLYLRWNFTGGTVTATAVTYFALPSGFLSIPSRQSGAASYSNAPAGCLVAPSDSSVQLYGTNGANLVAGDSLTKLFGNLVIEVI